MTNPAAGDTEADTRRNFQDVLTPRFEVIREAGEPIPAPHNPVDYVEVDA